MATKAEQVDSEIRARIAAGQLRPGDRLPTERKLAAELDASKSTVGLALVGLVSAGLLRAETRRGYFVAHREVEIVIPAW